VLEDPTFLGPEGERTLFALDCTGGKDVQRFSSYNAEAEILVPPGIQFQVTNRMPIPGSSGLVLVNAKQMATPKLFS
jgi:hypothetical protein